MFVYTLAREVRHKIEIALAKNMFVYTLAGEVRHKTEIGLAKKCLSIPWQERCVIKQKLALPKNVCLYLGKRGAS